MKGIRFKQLTVILYSLWALIVAANAVRPNILLIISEDNGPELGCYGDPYVQTPVLDRLAAEGVRFSRAYVPQAGCSQSRAALYTGLYPHQNGQIGLATWKFRLYREDTPNLVRSLKEAGYRTGIIGKLHMNPASAFPFDFASIPGSNFARRELKRYATDANRFMTSGESPFFLSVNFPDAHRPFLASVDGQPERPLEGSDVKPLPYFGIDTPELRQQTADYYNCMNRLDGLVGDLLATLEATGKAENTLVIYLGDHGADLLRGKRTSYEGGVRIPMILRWPAKKDWALKGREISSLVTTLDLMPTILQVAHASRVEGLPGRSLLPLLRKRDPPWRQYLFTEYHLHSAHNFYPQRTVRDHRFKLIWNLLPGEENPGYEFTNNRFFSGIQGAISTAPDAVRRSYDRMRVPPKFELYDLVHDPYEFNDLSGDSAYKEALNRLVEVLTRWRHETEDPLLDSSKLRRLQKEVLDCFESGKPVKGRLHLTYPEYFQKAG